MDCPTGRGQGASSPNRRERFRRHDAKQQLQPGCCRFCAPTSLPLLRAAAPVRRAAIRKHPPARSNDSEAFVRRRQTSPSVEPQCGAIDQTRSLSGRSCFTSTSASSGVRLRLPNEEERATRARAGTDRRAAVPVQDAASSTLFFSFPSTQERKRWPTRPQHINSVPH